MGKHLAFVLAMLASLMSVGMSPPFYRVAESDLPTGGEWIADPGTGLKYYLIRRPELLKHPENQGKSAGLYLPDPAPKAGMTRYGLANPTLELQSVLIHPVTHTFYALVAGRAVVPGLDGQLETRTTLTLARSKDALAWYDITPPDSLIQPSVSSRRSLADLQASLAVDASNPRRVCIGLNRRENNRVEALDDDHREWRVRTIDRGVTERPAAVAPADPEVWKLDFGTLDEVFAEIVRTDWQTAHQAPADRPPAAFVSRVREEATFEHVDLNDDGVAERIISLNFSPGQKPTNQNYYVAEKSSRGWHLLGTIEGKPRPLKERNDGFPMLESEWYEGGQVSTTIRYVHKDGAYVRQMSNRASRE